MLKSSSWTLHFLRSDLELKWIVVFNTLDTAFFSVKTFRVRLFHSNRQRFLNCMVRPESARVSQRISQKIIFILVSNTNFHKNESVVHFIDDNQTYIYMRIGSCVHVWRTWLVGVWLHISSLKQLPRKKVHTDKRYREI